MTVQRYLQIQQGQQNGMNGNSNGQQQSSHRKLDRSLSEPKSPKGQNQSTNSSRYKTELCRPFEESGVCKYGDKCQFAHGFQELRTLTRHPKYKTELCCTFHTTGLCPYGSRCHFIHNPEENRAKIMPSLPMPQPAMNHHNHHHHHQQQQPQQQPPPPPPPHHHHHHHSQQQQHHHPQQQQQQQQHHHHHQQQQQPHHVKVMHGMCHPNNHGAHQNTLRSLSIGSSVSVGSSSSTGELSPSSSPGMFDDPFAPAGFYGAVASNVSPTSSRGGSVAAAAAAAAGVALPHAFSAFGSDFEMSALAAAFSAAENKHRGLNLKSVASASAPGTPPFGSQLNLLSTSSSSSSCGPWGSPSSISSSASVSSSVSSSSSQDMFQFPGGELHCNPVNPGQLYADSATTQSSPVDSLSFEFEAIALGTPRARANANSPTQTRLPIFNQLAHSD